jgi:hypothetical protein
MLANVFGNFVAFLSQPRNHSPQAIDLGVQCVDLVLPVRNDATNKWDLRVERNIVAYDNGTYVFVVCTLDTARKNNNPVTMPMLILIVRNPLMYIARPPITRLAF